MGMGVTIPPSPLLVVSDLLRACLLLALLLGFIGVQRTGGVTVLLLLPFSQVGFWLLFGGLFVVYLLLPFLPLCLLSVFGGVLGGRSSAQACPGPPLAHVPNVPLPPKHLPLSS